MKYILTYHGHPVSKYDYYIVYAVNDYVIFDEKFYRSLQNFNVKHIPDLISSSFYWEEIGEVNDETKINNNKQKENIKNWKIGKTYYQYDKVKYKNNIYICSVDGAIIGECPPDKSAYWKLYAHTSEQEKEDKVTRICGNHIGNIKADNVVVYGDNTGNINATGEKSVVVVFGDITGNIQADQIIHVHDVDKTKIKEALAHVKDRRF